MSLKKTIENMLPEFIMKRYVRAKKNWKWRGKAYQDVFNTIYKENGWGGHQSISGRGSDEDQTALLVKKLPDLLRELNAKTMLDIPCGDFLWMQHVDLSRVFYTGGELVKDLVETNKMTFQNEQRKFVHLDLCTSELPQVDVVFCRDCLVHLSFELIDKALKNIVKSGSKYVMLTTFTNRDRNEDIVTGNWRALNFQQDPFQFGKPVLVFNEGFADGNSGYSDKCLGVWEVMDIAEWLKK